MNCRVMRRSLVADSDMRMFAERYSLSASHFLFSRQIGITVNLRLEMPEYTTCIPSNTVLSHAETRRLSSTRADSRNYAAGLNER